MAVEVEAGAYINQAGVLSHNPLHDIESLWWVGIWFLLCHYPPGMVRDTTAQRHFEVIRTYGETLFNNRTNPLGRRHALTGPDLLHNIEPESFPMPVQHLIVLLDEYREQLLTYYELYKPIESQAEYFFIPELHGKFSGIVKEAMTGLADDSTGLWLIANIKKHIAYINAKK
jgi:hypothetical protein